MTSTAHSYATREPIPLHQAELMLGYVVGADDREVWLAVGMALRAEFGDAALEAWLQWSAGAHNYNERDCRTAWRGFKARPGGYGMGTLIKLAMEGGYKFERSEAPDAAELARRRAERDTRARQETLRREQANASAEASALAVWREGLRQGRSAYAERKGIERPESCRFSPSGWLLVPMLRYDLPREQSMRGLQTIRPDGSKRFTFGMAKAGTACRLGLAQVGEPVLLCEGYATGMSLRMATERRFAVYVAFDAGNLLAVTDIVREAHPGSPLVICGDNDWRTADAAGRPLNPGLCAAKAALEDAQGQGATAVMTHPVFPASTDAERAAGDTDFNDLHRLAGLPAVRDQLLLAIEVAKDLHHG